jgi:uncharacterized linocin/CFP29 family protein
MYYQTQTAPAYHTAVPANPTATSPMAIADMPAAGPAEKALWARVSSTTNNGRDRVGWTPDFWDRIDRAVHDEMCRVGVGRRFLPLLPVPNALTVPADTITDIRESESAPTVLGVDEAAVTPLIEIWVEFALTQQQTAAEEALQTAVTLATRAANLLSQGEDLLLFQGDTEIRRDPLFALRTIQTRGGPGPRGLANAAADPPLLTIDVPLGDDGKTYGEETFTAVAEAYSGLQKKGHYGPYALVLPTKAYADAFAPLKNTLILTADRLLPIVEGRLYGTGTVPENIEVGRESPPKQKDVGVLLSLGGNTVDLAFGRDATTEFLTEDNQGLSRFRVYERFALRDKDTTGRVALLFERRSEEQ